MKYKTVLLDAFGTILRIKSGTHPYRQLMLEGRRNGRRPRPDDARVLMTFNGGLAHAADHLGITITPSRRSQLEEMLEEEVSSIQAFPDALEAVALLQERKCLVAVCSNLAFPYGRAVTQLFPTLNGYGFSFEIGAIKPDPLIYLATLDRLGIVPQSVSDQNGIIMTGDSLRCDCEGPQAIGITGLYLDRASACGIRDLMDFAKHVLNE